MASEFFLRETAKTAFKLIKARRKIAVNLIYEFSFYFFIFLLFFVLILIVFSFLKFSFFNQKNHDLLIELIILCVFAKGPCVLK